jgi:hypothetical protein
MDGEKLVHVNKSAKNILSIGQFGLFQVEDLNLITTNWFMLSVTDEQFWKIRCKLEAKQINCWLFKSKEGLQACQGSTGQQVYELYCSMVFEQMRDLDDTGLRYNGIKLFTDTNRYYGVPEKHFEMIDYPPVIRNALGRESVIVDDVHIFTVVKPENIKSQYIKQLGGSL